MTTLQELAQQLGAEVRNASAHLSIRSVSSSSKAESDTLVFAEDEATLEAARASQAGAIVLTEALAEKAGADKPLVITGHPRLFFARAAKAFAQAEEPCGIHPTAIIAADTRLGDALSIGPYVVIEAGASVGDRSRIAAGAVIGAGVIVGKDCRIYPRAVLYPGIILGDRVVVHAGAVLGGDGFGYVRDNATGEYLQFPQQGVLVLEDDVEIGANTTIDRGALEETRLERGVKLDNLVHLGHNVRVGQNVVIAAQTGISGSTVIGKNAVIGGQVGIGDHAFIGEKVILGSQCGILPKKKLKGPGMVFWGTPAKPLKEYLKELAALARLARI
jgi:UDP-3-O-[3-hydroxymyristoyl] glucosamine N-acyltransferase